MLLLLQPGEAGSPRVLSTFCLGLAVGVLLVLSIGLSTGRIGSGQGGKLVSDAELMSRLRHQQSIQAPSADTRSLPLAQPPLVGTVQVLQNVARGTTGGAVGMPRVAAVAPPSADAPLASPPLASAPIAVTVGAVEAAAPKPAYVVLPKQVVSGTATDPKALAAGEWQWHPFACMVSLTSSRCHGASVNAAALHAWPFRHLF